ncbi:hypothetical protein CRG98_050289 [Punica granatum]|uniref:Uncharacterized protein n=1 Tax=Punica granatum TaxID=22663 RepID=A0A2I0GKH0_PUNGR|nr:hypothetical protein CRG98_050289 [Punica granatum]
MRQVGATQDSLPFFFAIPSIRRGSHRYRQPCRGGEGLRGAPIEGISLPLREGNLREGGVGNTASGGSVPTSSPK